MAREQGEGNSRVEREQGEGNSRVAREQGEGNSRVAREQGKVNSRQIPFLHLLYNISQVYTLMLFPFRTSVAHRQV